jgi:hypothetical protein
VRTTTIASSCTEPQRPRVEITDRGLDVLLMQETNEIVEATLGTWALTVFGLGSQE